MEDAKNTHKNSRTIKFLTLQNITSNDITQIRKLWIDSFDKKSSDDIELLDTTIVGIIYENNKIVAISFLLCPTDKQLNSNKLKYYSNIKEQGVTSNDCYIYNFCVSKNKQKQGYGKMLLQNCHDYLKKLKKQKIILFVEKGNIPAIFLYNKFEYKVHMATPSGFIMEKNLQ